MTNEEKINAFVELTKGLSSSELRDLGNDLDNMADEQAIKECEIEGHQIVNDHCGRKEHRFCQHCYQRETDILVRQAKVDEAATCKVAEPSESLGSDSTLFSRLYKKWVTPIK